MRLRFWLLMVAGGLLLAKPKTLDFYFVDVEGGQATLIVTPNKESILVDTGWPGFNGRDAARIAAAAKAAGVKRIDYLITTHYHTDHVGGVKQLIERLPVRTFVDHGPNTETSKSAQELWAQYEEAARTGKRMIVKPGDKIPLKGVDVTVVAARGEHIGHPLPGAGAPNHLCGAAYPEDKSENARSVGFLLTYGNFRFIDLGDLTNQKESELVCPNNKLGTVDLYLTTHHGLNTSNAKEIVHALRPRVAVMNNGAKKGGTPQAYQIVRSAPGLEDLWQLHFALAGGKENNTAESMIANLEENCEGKSIKVSASKDGSMTVVNLRNNFSKTYAARAAASGAGARSARLH